MRDEEVLIPRESRRLEESKNKERTGAGELLEREWGREREVVFKCEV